VAMAQGQALDVAGLASADPRLARPAARLKGGAYTVDGPLGVGATLAGARADQLATLAAFGEPLGEAFQLRDDLLDGDAPATARDEVNRLVGCARTALDPTVLEPAAAHRLLELADGVAL